MIATDVRLRAVLLTVFLVVMIAAAVQFWPAPTPSATAAMPAEVTTNDSQLKRHFDWAVTQLRSGHYQQAINGFRAVLEQSPAMPEAYINTGFAHIELQQYEQAMKSFQTAIDLRPTQVNAYWGLAVSLEGLCDIAGAMGAMRTYIHLAPADDPFLVKANAALWEWEQLKTAGNDNNQGIDACNQTEEQAEKQ
jgi:tetratricopeptide (TPR) repeat protein